MYVILLLPSLQATDEKHRVHKRLSITRLIKCVYIVVYLETKWVDIYPSSAVAVELWWCKSSDTHVYTCIHVHACVYLLYTLDIGHNSTKEFCLRNVMSTLYDLGFPYKRWELLGLQLGVPEQQLDIIR